MLQQTCTCTLRNTNRYYVRTKLVNNIIMYMYIDRIHMLSNCLIGSESIFIEYSYC